MSGLLSPAVGVMNRLSVQGKLALLGLVALMPVVVLAYMLLDRIQGDLAFSHKETLTVPLALPARQLMQAAQAHRGVSQAVIGGNAAMASRLSELRDKVNAALKDGDAMNARFGAELGLSDEWQAIRNGWDAIQSRAVTVSGPESFRLHSEYIARIRDFIGHVADQTNATLDPELETYYLMDIFADRLPGLSEDAGRARALGTVQASRQKQTEAERIEISVLMQRMADGRAAIAAAAAKAAPAEAKALPLPNLKHWTKFFEQHGDEVDAGGDLDTAVGKEVENQGPHHDAQHHREEDVLRKPVRHSSYPRQCFLQRFLRCLLTVPGNLKFGRFESRCNTNAAIGALARRFSL